MRSIIKIVKLEFLLLFYSPVAWLVFILFTLRVGDQFSDRLTWGVHWEHIGNVFEQITGLYSPYNGLYANIRETLMFGMPFLTMGIMSRELSSGTIKLMQSSPLTSAQIVLGKFLSLMIYAAGFFIIIGAVIVTTNIAINHQDTMRVFVGLIGLMALVSLYAAIGLFMSSLTSYQIIAAISTIMVFLGLENLHLVWMRFDYLRDITYFLSLGPKLYQFEDGYVNSSHVAYYIIITVLCLSLMIIMLENKRKIRSLGFKIMQYAACVAVAIFFGVLSGQTRFKFYYDSSQTKYQTLTPISQEIVKKIDAPIRIHVYANALDENFRMVTPESVNWVPERFEKHQRFLKSEIKFDFTYYYDSVDNPDLFDRYKGKTLRQIAEKQAKTYKMSFKRFLSPDSIRKIIDLREEENRTVYQVEYKGKSAFLRFYDGWDGIGEDNITATLMRLQGRVQTVGFLVGHGERDIDHEKDNRNFKRMGWSRVFKYSLPNQGFDVVKVDLQKGGVPAGLQTLVIADPDSAFNAAELALLHQYIAEGGNLVVLGEPGKKSILDPLLSPVGVHYMPGKLVQQSANFGPSFIVGQLTPAGEQFCARRVLIKKRELKSEMPDAVGLMVDSVRGFKVDTLVKTFANNTWSTQRKVMPDSNNKLAPLPGDIVGSSLPLMVAMSRKVNGREQKIIVAGDADFMSNASMRKTRPPHDIVTVNFDLFEGTFRWMSNGELPVDITRPEHPDNKLNIKETGARVIRITFVYVIPGILLLAAIVILLRRKRK